MSDDIVATVGTINLDYRSSIIYILKMAHISTVLRKVLDVRDDMLDTISKSHQVQKGEIKDGLLRRLFIGVVKLFAPLL